MRDNPKKNPLARRKNRPRLINGAFISPELLAEAQKRRIEMLQHEIVHQAFMGLPFWKRWWIRIAYRIRNLWNQKTPKNS